jgi:hypothetical protein
MRAPTCLECGSANIRKLNAHDYLCLNVRCNYNSSQEPVPQSIVNQIQAMKANVNILTQRIDDVYPAPRSSNQAAAAYQAPAPLYNPIAVSQPTTAPPQNQTAAASQPAANMRTCSQCRTTNIRLLLAIKSYICNQCQYTPRLDPKIVNQFQTEEARQGEVFQIQQDIQQINRIHDDLNAVKQEIQWCGNGACGSSEISLLSNPNHYRCRKCNHITGAP